MPNSDNGEFVSSFSDQPSPIADLDYPSALKLSMTNDIPDRRSAMADR